MVGAVVRGLKTTSARYFHDVVKLAALKQLRNVPQIQEPFLLPTRPVDKARGCITMRAGLVPYVSRFPTLLLQGH